MQFEIYIKVKEGKLGKGLYSEIEIPANKPIIEFKGKICLTKNLPVDCEDYLQIGPDRFMTPNGSATGVDFINHSCHPNCVLKAIGNRVILYSLYVIPKGGQLTVDYSTTSTDDLDTWSMACKCGHPKCRKIISGVQYLSDQQKKEYAEKGLLPLFITHPNLFNKTW